MKNGRNGIEFSIKTNRSKEYLKAKDEATARALEIIGMRAERYVKDGTPVDTGRLKGSMTYKTKRGGASSVESPARSSDGVKGSPKENQVFIGTNVEYAAPVEFGTGGRAPKHMIKRGVQDHMKEYQDIWKTELKNENV